MKGLILAAFLVLHCLLSFAQTPPTDDGKITVQFLQLNDVYEIAPLENGAVGGMARVATLNRKLHIANRNTYTLLSGDFLSPSAIGTINFEGKAIRGRQMVEAMNSAGIDLVTFGNHEFDLKEQELKDRINESGFDWVCTNAWNKTGSGKMPFMQIVNHSENPIPQTRILVFKDDDGTIIRIGIFGICIKSGASTFAGFDEYGASADQAIAELKGKCDFIVAITHLPIDEDRKLAAAFPQIRIIFGGHEHVHSYDTVGSTIIAKADANARTVYLHQLSYDKNAQQLNINSRLINVTDSISDDSLTKAVVDKWINISNNSLRQQGFEPDQVLANIQGFYDGRESMIRHTSTNLTQMIAKAFSQAGKGSDCSIYNSGSIRLDDKLRGIITEYDIIRTLPYGGMIMTASMKGSLLRRTLDSASKHAGDGCFLQYDRISKDKSGHWLVHGKRLDDNKIYQVAGNDYVMTGKQQFLEFLNEKNPEMVKLSPPDPSDGMAMDLRKAVIGYLKKGGR